MTRNTSGMYSQVLGTIPKVNCGLKVIMVSQWRFKGRITYTTTTQDVNSGRGCAYVGFERMWELSVPSQLCCEPKTALKSKL